MVLLSEEQVRIIAERPLDNLHASFADKLRNWRESNENAWRADTAGLLGALVISPAADVLPLSDGSGSGSVAEKLFHLRKKELQTGFLQFRQLSPLVDAVVANLPDTEIWTAVINLIETINPSTPTPRLASLVPTAFATPVSRSSSRVADNEKRAIVEHELFYEIRSCTHRGVPGFIEKHFESINWAKKQQVMFKSILANHDGTRWKNFPADPWEKNVWAWLIDLEARALTGATYGLHTNKSAAEFKTRKGQMDIFFQGQKRIKSRQFYYKDVLVVGEHKRSFDASDFKACLLQLTRHVRSIFADQPMRRFVHAFTIKATTMELWIFDRSGAYSSGEFDIHHEPKKFARAFVAYATMDDEAMGLDRSAESKNGHRYITVDGANGEDKRVELKRLLFKQSAVVCRGTTCYAIQNGVAKFSWRSAKRQLSEAKHLRTAREKGVEGVATLVGHRDIMTIDDLRAGLEFSKATLQSFRTTVLDGAEYNRILAPHAGNAIDSDTSTSSRKRKSLNEDTRPFTRRRRSSSQKTGLRQANNDRTSAPTSHETKPSLYTSHQNDPYENRIFSCLLISPAGRVISDFQSPQELLESLRDAIRAHQSLYIKGRILHRDISTNNIIITRQDTAGSFKGMLIDLDLAKERDSKPSGARNQTGTMQFMAVEVLRDIDHTYRHDLESFFYVLLWMCARCAWDLTKEKMRNSSEVAPEASLLRQWKYGSFKDIAIIKMGHMTVDGVDAIMEEFPAALAVVKPLCLRIRNILFPYDRDLRMFIGTPAAEPERLYKNIIAAYDETISQVVPVS